MVTLHVHRLLILTFVSLGVASCTDKTIYDTPHLETRVVDANTKLPISDAHVLVWNGRDPDKRRDGVSDKQGNVLIEPLTHVASTFGPFDSFPPSGKARIESYGYLPKEIDVLAGIGEMTAIELSPIK